MTKPCILSDRIYVPVEYVNDSILDQFTYELKNENPDDENPFEVIKGVIKTYIKVRNTDGSEYYGFARGNIPKIGELFGDLPWLDKTAVPPMTTKLTFKGTLRTWETNKISQQEAADEWLQKRYGILRASPRFGKCCLGNTIIHTVEYGSIPIQELFDSKHPDGEYEPRQINLSTKDGIYSTSFLYKKIVDQTIEIKTKKGFLIEATPNHPLWIKKENGFDWEKMENLKKGDILGLQSNTNVFTERQTRYASLYARYIQKDRKYSKQIVLRIMKLGKSSQKAFLEKLIIDREIELSNEKVLHLLQIFLLNLGLISSIKCD